MNGATGYVHSTLLPTLGSIMALALSMNFLHRGGECRLDLTVTHT